MDWLDLLAVQGTLKSLLQHHSSKASISTFTWEENERIFYLTPEKHQQTKEISACHLEGGDHGEV